MRCEDEGDVFAVYYTNRGDPYRQGIEIGIQNNDFKKDVSVMLEDNEVRQLRDILIELCPLQE